MRLTVTHREPPTQPAIALVELPLYQGPAPLEIVLQLVFIPPPGFLGRLLRLLDALAELLDFVVLGRVELLLLAPVVYAIQEAHRGREGAD